VHRLIAAILLAAGILAAGGLPPAMAHPVRPVEQSTDAGPVAPATVFSAEPSQIPAGTASLAATPPSPLAVAGALLALAALFVVLGIRRRVLALGLALVLGVLAFESAVHSVHHLGTSEESKCAVAVAAAHVQGAVDEPVIALAEPRYAGVASAVVEPVRRAAQPWRAWRGRAPPSIPVS
jgi:hypothetical protein